MVTHSHRPVVDSLVDSKLCTGRDRMVEVEEVVARCVAMVIVIFMGSVERCSYRFGGKILASQLAADRLLK